MGTRIFSVCFAILFAVLPACLEASAAEGTIFGSMQQKCEGDVGTYCSAVTPGAARLAHCLHAHEDEVSAQCAVAVYDGIVGLEITLGTLGAYARTCRTDLLKFCGTTPWGQGRLHACPAENKSALAPGCRSVLDSARPKLQKLGAVTRP